MDWATILPIAGTGAWATAGLFTVLTKTPDPNTTWGKVYRVIDWVALNVGRAKETGLIPTDPAADKIADRILAAAKQALGAAVLCTGLAGLAACSALPSPVPDAASTSRVQAEIVSACTASGMFKAVDGALSAAVPVAALPVAAINAGVDIVCRNPAQFAADASTAEWVAKNLVDIVKAKAVQG